MAKTRMVNTRFWGDGYIAELDPIEKLLFLYLLTNQYTDLCGVYELPVRTIVFETGIEEERVRSILTRFSLEKKVEYVDGWVIVKNFLKHQSKSSPKVAQGIARSLKELPEDIRSRIGYAYHMDTISHSDLDSDLDSDSMRVADATAKPIFERKIRDKDEEYRSLVKDLAANDYLSETKIHDIILEEFLPYWLERGENAKKSRWEKEKVFDYQRRVRTWIKNFHRKDYTCSKKKWHREGERCYCVKPEVEIDYKRLPPSEFSKSINKRI